jgi:hypothetical protein
MWFKTEPASQRFPDDLAYLCYNARGFRLVASGDNRGVAAGSSSCNLLNELR